MLHRLYNEYEALNAHGRILAEEVQNALDPLINTYKGTFSLRDVESVIHSTVSVMVAEKVLVWATNKKKQERNHARKTGLQTGHSAG